MVPDYTVLRPKQIGKHIGLTEDGKYSQDANCKSLVNSKAK